MKTFAYLIASGLVFGCSTPQRGYVDCNEQNIGVRSGELICTNVGFGVYRWQIEGQEVTPIELFESFPE